MKNYQMGRRGLRSRSCRVSSCFVSACGLVAKLEGRFFQLSDVGLFSCLLKSLGFCLIIISEEESGKE